MTQINRAAGPDGGGCVLERRLKTGRKVIKLRLRGCEAPVDSESDQHVPFGSRLAQAMPFILTRNQTQVARGALSLIMAANLILALAVPGTDRRVPAPPCVVLTHRTLDCCQSPDRRER